MPVTTKVSFILMQKKYKSFQRLMDRTKNKKSFTHETKESN